MQVFAGGKLDSEMFAPELRGATQDLSEVLVAAALMGSAAIESTHVLVALAKVPGGETRRGIERRGLTVDQWERGLAECARKGGVPPGHLVETAFDPGARAMLQAAATRCVQLHLSRISEPVLLLSALEHLTADVADRLALGEIDVQEWRAELERLVEPIVVPDLFAGAPGGSADVPGEGHLNLALFAPGARKVLELMRTEGEALGYTTADPRHLLLALLAYEKGATHYGLHHQGLTPRKVHEGVMLNLRSRAKRTRSVLPLTRAHLQPILLRILRAAAELAARDRAALVFEPHLLRGLLTVESQARQLLEHDKVDILELRETAESYGHPEEEPDQTTIASIDTVRERLHRRVVGQEDAVTRILPYVQRMRFGFTTPGRPVGVFLFCGQSGSGKTEMAKELARAVYGSEENLVFLEMGQFNSPESMNIFVGAPPGYVGYGEGKLTNGLRDKPRSVVLFDEVEKAHAKVLDALLRFLDEGRVDDPAGPVRDGTECIAILTSNVGAGELSKLWAEVATNPNWRSIVRARLREAFEKREFRPEFLNRVDEIILFRTLTEANYAEIAQRLIERDTQRLRKEKQIDVADASGVAEAIGAFCFGLGEGARAAQRLTQAVVITPVIQFVLENACPPPVRLKVRAVKLTSERDAEPAGIVELAEAAT